jgi:hypothetical protein
MLQGRASLTELVDAGDLPTLPGATPSNQFLGYAIADPAGKPNDGAARDFLRQLCDYELQVDVTGPFLQSVGVLPEAGSNVLVPWHGGSRVGTVIGSEPSLVDPRVIVEVPLEGNDEPIQLAFGAEVVQVVPHPSVKT